MVVEVSRVRSVSHYELAVRAEVSRQTDLIVDEGTTRYLRSIGRQAEALGVEPVTLT
jgi:hypothetical protein